MRDSFINSLLENLSTVKLSLPLHWRNQSRVFILIIKLDKITFKAELKT